jgi:CubicO group peptidase (beta-lactamase class C family)
MNTSIKITILALALVGFLTTCNKKSTQMDTEITLLRLVDGSSVPTAELETFIEQAMEKADVTGLSCAIINDGRVVYRKAFGDRKKSTGARNDEETVFAAASFSKSVFAYLVMLLAEEGVVDLDRPLYE